MSVFDSVVNREGSPPVAPRKERRKRDRMPSLRVSSTGLSSNLWELELVPAKALLRLENDITALTERALEPNIFFDPRVLQAAWPRLNSLLAPRGCWMACLWETMADGPRTLRLFLPLAVQKIGFPKVKVIRPLANDYMPVGTPLLDPSTPDEACEMLLQLLGAPCLALPPVLDLTWQRAQGPVVQHLITAANRLGLSNRPSRQHQRATLTAAKSGALNTVVDVVGKKRAKEFARLNRRLEEQAPVSFHIHREQEAVLDAFEAFVGLELAGWKGRRSTALYNHKKITAFSREISARLATAGASEIVEMRHGSRVVASLILFGRAGRWLTWKIAFAEDLYRASPGQQVMVHATLQLLKRKSFISADSLAVRDHPMINRLWQERIAMKDVTIALNRSGARKLERAVAAKNRRDALVQRARKLMKRIR